jgi:putative tryptophan/tyrosine transport system substrate-binding protein
MITVSSQRLAVTSKTGANPMFRRIVICLLLFVLLLTVSPTHAQQSKKIPRIGFLFNTFPADFTSRIDVFRGDLRELGYVEGKTILFEFRYAEGNFERLSDLAAELVRLNVDIIVVSGGRPTAASRKATATIPIVVASAGDLLRAGLVASLAQPGGNITGSTVSSADVSGKRLALLKEAVPKATRIAVLWHPSTGDRPGGITTDWDEVMETEIEARRLGIKAQSVELKDPKQFERIYAGMVKQQTKAVILIRGSFITLHHTRLLELALKHRLPSMCEAVGWARDGCLMSYGPEELYAWRRAAVFVDKILKGTKPADIPVEQPKKFEFVINLKTAKAIGLNVPQSLLYRADKVIK